MGIGVDRLNSSIEEFDAITKEMNTLLEKQIMQQVMDIVLSVDRNQDFHIKEPQEVKRLTQRLKNLPNVEFDEENFRKITRYDAEDAPGIKLEDVMAMFRNLKDPNMAPEENIFRLHPEEQIRKEYCKKRDSGVYERRNLTRMSGTIDLDV